MKEKKCTKCKEIKPLSEFRKCKTNKDGLKYNCKDCQDIYAKASYKKNKVKILILNKAWRDANKDKVKLYRVINKKRDSEYKKEWRLKNKKRLSEYRKKARELNPKKYKAVMMLNYKVLSGEILKPEKCSQCFSDGRIEAHHTDYSKPLDVIWLCVPCHKKEHLNLKKVG